jgi:serine/threonine protein kinase
MKTGWNKAKNVFVEALKLAPAGRAAFLDEICAGDAETRREVESLLASYDDAASFMEDSPVGSFADLNGDHRQQLSGGASFAHYEIIEQIGAGGMGEVYLARDKKLDRRVAVKILNHRFARHESNLERFTREARAASGLNHPNILVIHEIGESHDLHYIVSEYVEGKTLRELLNEKPPELNEILDISIQIANALAAAHKAGIIHRDIKPENIMIRPDGLVKILDFGLAKLVAPENRSVIGFEDSAYKRNETAKGVILGTVQYMSPEQARGQPVDERTDIFSFGVVLYEMLTERTPFAGETVSETFANLINREPQPLSGVAGNIPEELQKIVWRTLRKNKSNRFQSIRDVLIDLKAVRDESRLQVKLRHQSEKKPTNRTTEEIENKTTRDSKLETGDASSTLKISGAEIAGTKTKNRATLIIVLLLAFVLSVLALGFYKMMSQPSIARSNTQTNPPPAFQAMKITKLTDTGKAGSVAISPDGKYVVHSQINGREQSLWIRHVATDSNVQIIPPAKVVYWRMTFSPDGNFIYFCRDRDTNESALYRIPVLGGEPVRLSSNIASSVSFSPDGRQIAFIRNFLSNVDGAIIIANADGTGERQLIKPNAPTEDFFFNSDLAWSPDGKRIATSLFSSGQGKKQLIEVDVEDGSVKPINQDDWADIGRIGWLADGSALIAAAQAEGGQTSQIYFFSYPGGQARRITNDTDLYDDLSLTADGSALVTTQKDTNLNLWTLPLSKTETPADESKARQITFDGNRLNGKLGIAVSPTGKIVYTTLINGKDVLWVSDADGANPKRLTEETFLALPIVSPDGKFIVVAIEGKNGEKGENLWRMNIDGSNPVKLTNGGLTEGSSFTPDGRSVVFTNYDDKTSVKIMPIEGGEPFTVIDKFIDYPQVSPDGKWIFGGYRENENADSKPALFSFDGKNSSREIKILDLRDAAGAAHWTPDGRSLAFPSSVDKAMNIWAQPIAGGKPKPLTNFKSQFISWFGFAPDGKSLVLARGSESSDVVLISNFR